MHSLCKLPINSEPAFELGSWLFQDAAIPRIIFGLVARLLSRAVRVGALRPRDHWMKTGGTLSQQKMALSCAHWY